MTRHQIMSETSLLCWVDLEPLVGERQQIIFDVLCRSERPMTAREVLEILGYRDMNMVRPRITELYKAGRIRIKGAVQDHITGRKVFLFEPIKKL